MLKLQQQDGRKKAPRPSGRLNLEIERWAFGDYDTYGDISMLDIAEQEEPGEITSIKKSPKGGQEGSSENGSKEENGENKPAKRPSTGLFKRGNNAMSRQVPGTLQKNITTERKFFKDILQLSQQRFMNLHNIEFQKKAFINRQAIKGIYRAEQPNKRSLPSSVSMNSSYSLNQSFTATNNDAASVSTGLGFEIPPLTPRIRSESVFELKEPNLNRRQSLNLTSARRLNLELARMHTIDLIELENKRKKSSKRQNDSPIVAATEAVVQEIKEINNPEAKPAPVAEPAIPQIKSKTIKIIEEPKVNLKKRFTVTDDSRYQSLLVTMTNVYRPTTAKHNANENPNERILRLYKSNTVLMKDNNYHLAALQDQEKRNRNTFEENFQQFERMISNII